MERSSKQVRFRAPEIATPVRTRSAWLVMIGVFLSAAGCALSLHTAAQWPAPAAEFTIVALALLVGLANAFGAHRTVNGLSEYTSLAIPIGFAMVLVLDWRGFVAAVVLGEIFTFVSEVVRRENPTMWYLRIYNVASLVLAGAVAATLLAFLRPAEVPDGPQSWLSPLTAIALLLAAVAYKIVDSLASSTIVTLEASEPLASIRVPVRTFGSQLTLFLIAIPFAHAWSRNVWESLFALAPLGVAYRVLALPELEHRVRVDARTGLTNAAAFDLALAETVADARRRAATFALLAIDIDYFKQINDSFGHPIGDAVIERFAAILADVARGDDVAARTGGEEFALLVRGVEPADALALAERVRCRVAAEHFAIAGGPAQPIELTASIGVAVFPGDGASPQELYVAADAALYRAKNDGRNAVRAADDSRRDRVPSAGS
jgi:diguanylate cyclase (GGDEF)-like protein